MFSMTYKCSASYNDCKRIQMLTPLVSYSNLEMVNIADTRKKQLCETYFSHYCHRAVSRTITCSSTGHHFVLLLLESTVILTKCVYLSVALIQLFLDIKLTWLHSRWHADRHMICLQIVCPKSDWISSYTECPGNNYFSTFNKTKNK